jgi:hypothetical protein
MFLLLSKTLLEKNHILSVLDPSYVNSDTYKSWSSIYFTTSHTDIMHVQINKKSTTYK